MSRGSVYRFVTKRCIGSKLVHQTSNILYFNKYSRQFCVVKEILNSPEISAQNEQKHENEYFEYLDLKQTSLLNDDNIQSNTDFINKQQKEKHSERLKAKTEKSCQYDTYPEIFKLIDNSASGQQIKQYIIDYMDENNYTETMERLSKYSQSTNNDNTNELKTDLFGPRKPAIFTHGMRKCFILKEYKFGWDLYEIARQNNCVSNDLYSIVLFGKMHESVSNQALQECFDIFDQWREEEKRGGLHINAKIYSSLISSCMKIRNFSKAFHVYNNLMLGDLDKNTIKNLLVSSSVRQEIVNLYCKSQGVESAIKFVSDCKINYGVLPTQNIISTLIAGCGAEINKNSNLIEIAQKLFVSAFDVIQNEDSENESMVSLRVFSSLLVVYCKIGDYKSCIDLLNQMQNNEKWPNPNKYCIAPALKSIGSYNLKIGNDENKLTTNEKWELIENILEIQKKNNLSHDVVTYSILFHSCDGDRGKMMKLYNEMIKKDKIIPNQMALQNILLGGLDGFIKDIKKNSCELVDKDIKSFIDWIFMELNKYHLSLSQSFTVKFKAKLDIIKSLQ